MRFVVLGAAGSIGNAVARRARLAGHPVRAVVRAEKRRLGLPPGTEIHSANLLEEEAVLEACEGADVLVHAANAPYPDWPEIVPRLARNALKAAEATGALLAFPGNVYVYGRPRTNPVREDHPMEPHTAKGKIRLEIERAYMAAHRAGRARVVIPRYPDFYGPNVLNDLIRPIFEGAMQGKPCGWPIDLDVGHEFILVDDAAAAMIQLIQTPAAHGLAVHVPGPGPISPGRFLRLAYEAAGHEARIRVFGRATVAFVGLFNRDIRAAREMMYLFEEPLLLDGSLYRSLTGVSHPTTPYEEGVRRTIDWFRSHPVEST